MAADSSTCVNKLTKKKVHRTYYKKILENNSFVDYGSILSMSCK